MATRKRISSAELLDRVEATGGRPARSGAQRLLTLADELGAQRFGRHAGISLRLAGPISSDQDWITLFVLSTAGTVYVNWLDRWQWIGLPRTVASRYRNALVKTFGDSIQQHPSAHRNAVPISRIVTLWDEFERSLRAAAAEISSFVQRQSNDKGSATNHTDAVGAIEGQAVELRVVRRTRSQRLRTEAMERSGGRCMGCGVTYGLMLGGRGWRVLQVHHRRQLSERDEAAITKVEDLAVVCANCHMLIHADREAPMGVEAVVALWHQYRTGSRQDVDGA